MKTVCITWPEAVHDGLGGVHPPGSVVALPADIAQIFVDKGRAKWADDINETKALADAKQAAVDRAAQARVDEAKAHADKAMAIHDAMPKEVRDQANELGGDVAIEYLNAQLEETYASRGLPRPVGEPLPEFSDDEINDGFDDAIADAEDKPRKRKGRRK